MTAPGGVRRRARAFLPFTLPSRPGLLLLAALVAPGAGCAGPGEGTDDGAPEAEPMAAALLDPALFDSIAWPGEGAALERGGTVYGYSCRKCHGDTGAGDGGYQRNGRAVRPPSFLPADWPYATDRTALRQRIWEGGPGAMPHWGEAGLTPRDVDAVARYVQRLYSRAE